MEWRWTTNGKEYLHEMCEIVSLSHAVTVNGKLCAKMKIEKWLSSYANANQEFQKKRIPCDAVLAVSVYLGKKGSKYR